MDHSTNNQKIHFLSNKNQELENQQIALENTISEMKQVIDRYENRITSQNSEINNLQSAISIYAKSDQELKSKIENMKK